MQGVVAETLVEVFPQIRPSPASARFHLDRAISLSQNGQPNRGPIFPSRGASQTQLVISLSRTATQIGSAMDGFGQVERPSQTATQFSKSWAQPFSPKRKEVPQQAWLTRQGGVGWRARRSPGALPGSCKRGRRGGEQMRLRRSPIPRSMPDVVQDALDELPRANAD